MDSPAAEKEVTTIPTPSDFIDVQRFVPGIIVDLRYAGMRHPFGEAFYPLNRAFLRRGTAGKLARAQRQLAAMGLRLVVWDAYRPLSIQKAMWAQVPNADFVAPPSRGSNHNRGAAVDVTLARHDGRPVAMPTDFDDFSPRAYSDSVIVTLEEQRNRETLRRTMTAAGFRGISSEWWHFNDGDSLRYPVCDSSLHALNAKARERGYGTRANASALCLAVIRSRHTSTAL